MPPLGLHMALARQVSESLPIADLSESSGEYLLGSTAPDIRVLTRWDREQTHFFDIFNFDEQHSVAGLFQSHPQLADPALLNRPTRAFIAGYLTHLEADELWIIDVYRPYFGASSTLAGDSRANVLDRVLQYELEREVRLDAGFMETCRDALAGASMDIETGFLERETLERWREVNLEVAQRPADWERFRQIASRHLKAAGIETSEAVDAFMTEVPELLEETRRHVSLERVQQFMEDARERSKQAVKGYFE